MDIHLWNMPVDHTRDSIFIVCHTFAGTFDVLTALCPSNLVEVYWIRPRVSSIKRFCEWNMLLVFNCLLKKGIMDELPGTLWQTKAKAVLCSILAIVLLYKLPCYDAVHDYRCQWNMHQYSSHRGMPHLWERNGVILKHDVQTHFNGDTRDKLCGLLPFMVKLKSSLGI